MLSSESLSRIAGVSLVVGGVALLITGCETLTRTPQVDLYKPVATTAQAPVPVQTVATGSLYSKATYRPAFEDRRARFVGDTVTITIVENVTAKQTQTSTIDKSSSTSASLTAVPLLSASTLGRLSTDAGSTSAFEGKGGTESANTFTGSITATVVEVLPNGHLVVTGEKQIGVNQNVDVLRFSGTIDPRAIQANSLVSSQQVANVRIESRSRGQSGEVQAMPWLARFFMTLLPF
jgi:flagellar L-ring protein precursor FlgH